MRLHPFFLIIYSHFSCSRKGTNRDEARLISKGNKFSIFKGKHMFLRFVTIALFVFVCILDGKNENGKRIKMEMRIASTSL